MQIQSYPESEAVPQQFTMQQTRDGLEISYRWLNSADRDTLFWGGAVFAVLGLLAFFSGQVAYMVLGGLALLLAVINWDALFRNRTTITLSHQDIIVQSGPAPYPANNVQLLRSAIQTITLKRQFGFHGMDGEPLYHVQAQLHDGSRRVVVRYLTRDQAEFIARRLTDLR